MIRFWETVRQRAEAALAAGAMHSFECALEHVEQEGIPFVVRVATRFPKGETAAGRGSSAPKLAANPFLDPDPALLVTELGPTHRVMLNKFSVIREHILVVTRAFVHQQTLLDGSDFTALAACMEEGGALAFYNGGEEAGASQPHKHLQMVTLPLSPRAPIPLGETIDRAHAVLPFRHALARLRAGDIADADTLEATYRELLERVDLRPELRDGLEWQPRPYNLVVTRDWMLLVPRSRDRYEGISINALAFAGSFFVRDPAGLEKIARAGPLAVLRAVAIA